MKIEDGKGSGRLACVDDKHRLLIKAESRGSEETAAAEGLSFIAQARCHLAATVSGGFLALTNSTSDKTYHITRIYIDAFSLSDDIIITQIKNPVLSNGTDVSDTRIVNKNFAAAGLPQITMKVSDGSSDLTYTNGTEYHAFVASSLKSSQRDMVGTNIISPGKTILWGWETVDGAAAVDGEIISISVNFYEEEFGHS